MKIGILQCGHTLPDTRARFGDFPEMFASLLDGHGFTYAAYDVEQMVFPETVDTCDGWLLTGSRHGAYEDHPFIPPLEQFIRDAYAAAVPMVGICFGHQIIAQALGGHVEKFKAGWSVGLTDYRFESEGNAKLNAWHQDQVIRIPDDAKIIASSDFCETAALAYGNRALTIQPHPEFGGDFIEHYASSRKGTLDYPDDRMDRALARASEPDDNGKIATQIAAFFKQSRTVKHV
ncbi:type 1 glutamine amidotransferase [Litoreibacter roseus]|uniref:Glutamine amidotransferase n=1 Tax=Litoreibacter roseus TaxID=2601869 RepID=A0A6N6JHR8_9RHOB|nr:type 1 glutamine amidotransferase [Litoreibacter roseus]GFE65913.1 glutamine amidotransferase [Litoreibacter roseus]